MSGMKLTRWLGVMLALGIATLVEAKEEKKNRNLAEQRCLEDDSLDNEEAKGRIAWARKCNLITDDMVDIQLKIQMYSSFHHEDGRVKAPTDVNASCDGLSTQGRLWCSWGCYTPDQEILFGQRYLKIEEAASQGEPTVTALTKDAALDDLSFAEQDIASFVMGETEELVYRFTTENKLSLEVTDIHPMIKSDGSVIKASKLVVGDKLVNRSGVSETIVKIDTRMFKGKVYNIKPVSLDKRENIFVAQELLTGSNRFQNEWIETDFRLNLRKSADVSGL